MGQIDTLNDIVNNPNRMRESYVMKNHIELYNTILDYNKLDISFKEKLWYFYNKITKEVLCKCGNKSLKLYSKSLLQYSFIKH